MIFRWLTQGIDKWTDAPVDARAWPSEDRSMGRPTANIDVVLITKKVRCPPPPKVAEGNFCGNNDATETAASDGRGGGRLMVGDYSVCSLYTAPGSKEVYREAREKASPHGLELNLTGRTLNAFFFCYQTCHFTF